MISPPSTAQRRGITAYGSNLVNAGVDVVTAAANTGGIMLRTVLLITRSGFFCGVQIGGASVFYAASAQTFHYLGPGFLISPGLALRVGGNGAVADDAGVYLTYDLL